MKYDKEESEIWIGTKNGMVQEGEYASSLNFINWMDGQTEGGLDQWKNKTFQLQCQDSFVYSFISLITVHVVFHTPGSKTQ